MRLGMTNSSVDLIDPIYRSLDARTFKSMICNRSIEGAYKNITMNSICDRVDIGYAIYDMDPDTGELEVKQIEIFSFLQIVSFSRFSVIRLNRFHQKINNYNG